MQDLRTQLVPLVNDDHLGGARKIYRTTVNERIDKRKGIGYLNLDCAAGRVLRGYDVAITAERGRVGRANRRFRRRRPVRRSRHLTRIQARWHDALHIILNNRICRIRGARIGVRKRTTPGRKITVASGSVHSGVSRRFPRRVRHEMIGVERASKLDDSQQHYKEQHRNKGILQEAVPIFPLQPFQARSGLCCREAGFSVCSYKL